jgi:uncharacterized protein involved in exopolysaccharide biosynthesis
MTRFESRIDGRSEAYAPTLALAPPASAPADIDRTAELGDIWRILARRRGWIVWTVALMVAAALAYGLLTPALYTASAQILIDPRDRQVMTNDINPVAVAPDGGVTQVESQARVIESASVLLRAIAALDLTKDPEFGGAAGGLADRLRGLIGRPAPASTPAEIEERTLRNVKKRLAIKRADKVFVIDIILTAKDPNKAASLANAIATAYLADQTDARTQAAQRASDSLAARLDEQRERVREAENRAEAYKAANDLVRSGGRLVTEQQLTEINLQLSTAQAKTAELKARIDQIERARKGGNDATAEAIQSSVITRLRQQFAELSERQADLGSQLGSRHPTIVSLGAQIGEVRGLINAELGRVERSARADYERALASERSIAASLKRLQGQNNTTAQASVRLRELEREVEANRAVYTNFLNRAREIREQSGIDSTNARIITRATPPEDKSWPLPGLFALGALAAGMGLGTGAAMVREYLSPTILSRNQLQRLAEAPVIGTIPNLALGRKAPGADAEATKSANLVLARLLGARGAASGGPGSVFVTSGAADEVSRRRTAQLLAAAAEARGLRVLYIETDPREGGSSPGFFDILRGEEALNTVLRTQQPTSSIRLLGVGRQKRGELVPSSAAQERFRSEVEHRFDLVVIDGGALVENVQAGPLMELADAVLFVACAGSTAQRDVLDAVEAAALAGRPISAALLVTAA